jgi:hypothetical protein
LNSLVMVAVPLVSPGAATIRPGYWLDVTGST